MRSIFTKKIPSIFRLSSISQTRNFSAVLPEFRQDSSFPEMKQHLNQVVTSDPGKTLNLFHNWLEHNDCNHSQLHEIVTIFPKDFRLSAFRAWATQNSCSVAQLKDCQTILPKFDRDEAFTIWRKFNEDNSCSLRELNEVMPNADFGLKKVMGRKWLATKSHEGSFEDLIETSQVVYNGPRINILTKWLESKKSELDDAEVSNVVSYINNTINADKPRIAKNSSVEEIINFLHRSSVIGRIISSIPKLHRTMGVELEFYARREPEHPPEWKMVEDTSIQSDDEKRRICKELVSPVLYTKDDLHEVASLCDSISSPPYHATTNATCALHVHIGMNLKANQIEFTKQLLINYGMLEELGLKFPERDYKMTSLKLEEPSRTLDRFDIITRQQSFEEITKSLGSRRKTDPVNLHAIAKHGTIEFRAHGGTVDSKNVIAWMKLVNNLVGLTEEMVLKEGRAHVPTEMREILNGTRKKYMAGKDVEKLHNMLEEFRTHSDCLYDPNKPSTAVKPYLPQSAAAQLEPHI